MSPRSHTILLLARHGQSTWNASGRWQGQADPPLSDLGVRQALVAARGVDAWGGVDLVVTSDLRRAHQTAVAIARALEVPVEIDARLRERDAGEWTGLTRDEIEAAWPGFLAARGRPPGFENDEVLLARFLPGVEAIVRARPGARVLVVTHGGVVRTLERHLGVDAPPLPNLGARELLGADGTLAPGERHVLVAGGDVAVTVPGQI